MSVERRNQPNVRFRVVTQSRAGFLGSRYRKAMQLLGFSLCAIEPEGGCAFKWMKFGQYDVLRGLPMLSQATKRTPMSAWLKRISHDCFIALAAPMVLLVASLPVFAQDQQGQPQPQQQPPQQPQQQQPQPQQPQQQALTRQQVQQLVAPIALYPDALLAQVLTASTYPLEVTLAARWAEKNPNLKGPALEEAMQKEPWDPSVKGLTSVPQVLAMMNDKLDWTQQLGEAFLAQPDDVQNAVQALRAKADEAGNLKSSKEQKVRRVAATPSPGYVGPPEYIVIEPVEPEYIYVPVYDPVVVYGVGYWPPAYAPFYWYPRWWTVGPVIGFATAAAFVGPALWYRYNWGYRGYGAIQTNTVLYSKFNRVNVNTGGGQFQSWKFDAAHRTNVPFKNTNLQQQFGSVSTKGVQGIQTGTGLQGTQIGKGIQGTQTGKGGAQGVKELQGTQTSKGAQGMKELQKGTQTGKGAQGMKELQGTQTSKGAQEIKTSKAVQGNQPDRKSIHGVQTGSRMQGGQQRIQGMQMSPHVQKMQGGKGMQGGKKNVGKGQGNNRH